MKNYRRFVLLMLSFLLASVSVLTTATAYAIDLSTQVVVTAKPNSAPIAENIDLNTFRNIAVKGTFKATDPDGESVTFNIVSQPKKGEVATNDDGTFTYTPAKDKKGHDKFTYVATDASGNTSAQAQVNVTIEKQETKITYSDMEGNDAYYAALVLADKHVFVGQKLGDEYFFLPNEPVTRGEFLAMCMNLTGEDILSGVTRTGFYDDESISSWEKPYISTALMSGIISGYKDDEGHLVFSSNGDITFSQAAVILNNTLGISDVASVWSPNDNADNSWAFQAAANLNSCGVAVNANDGYSSTLTRADAAKLLAGALEIMKNRDK